MLIGISIIFLILEDIENTKYKNLINLFYTFHIFKRGIESIPLTLISNYKYSLEGIQTGNLFLNYSEYLGAKYPLLRKNLINEVLLKDSYIKLTTIIQSFNSYLIFHSHHIISHEFFLSKSDPVFKIHFSFFIFEQNIYESFYSFFSNTF